MTGEDSNGRRLAYEPSLDGLRALAVGAVLLFHGGVAGTTGGFLGVSVFFTLSGFLITLLLLRERDATGHISLRGFWSRRVRRLSPAAMACVAVVLLTSAWWLDPIQLRNLPGDGIAALANVANWRFVADEQSYADLFATGPSPLVHFWSLAIEEQFYLVFPVLMAALLALPLRRRAVAAVLAALTIASVVAMLLTSDHDLAYYGTHTRAAEFLVGALLAFVVAAGWLERLGPRIGAAASWAGWLAVGGFAVLVATTDHSTSWLYRGGFPALSLIWAAMIVAALVPGHFRRASGVAALAVVGRMSYGLYLVHWPVFLALGPDRVGADGVALFGVRMAASVAITVVLYHLLEQPIRTRRLFPTVSAASMAYALAAVCLLVTAALVVRSDRETSIAADVPDEVIAFSAADQPTGEPAADALTASGAIASAGQPSPAADASSGSATAGAPRSSAPEPPAPVRVLVIGSDDGAVARLRAESEGRLVVTDAVQPGCPLSLTDGELADPAGPWANCRSADVLPATVRGFGTRTQDFDVVLVALGAAERERLALLGGEDAVSEHQDIRNVYFSGVDRAATALSAISEDGYDLLFLDGAPQDDLVSNLIDVAHIRAIGSTVIDPTVSDDQLVDAIVAAARPQAAARTKLLVIGDSTSYALAAALDAAAADRYEVVWAGQSNCPLTPAYEDRWWGEVKHRTDDCPSAERMWPDVVDSFEPDVILAVASLPELAEQRYGDDDVWHRPGDPEYLTRHVAGGAGLAAIAARSGAVLLLADAPAFGPDGFGAGPLGEPDRLVAWNGVLAGWAERWAMMRVVPYGEALAVAELAAGGPGSLRADGAHLSPEAAQTVVRDGLLPGLAEWIASTRAAMIESGCQLDGPAGPRIDLATCDRHP